MINSNVINGLLKDNKTASKAIEILKGLEAYYGFVFDPKKDTNEKECVIKETVSKLEELNSLAASISLGPVYIEEEKLESDMKDYFVENLK